VNIHITFGNNLEKNVDFLGDYSDKQNFPKVIWSLQYKWEAQKIEKLLIQLIAKVVQRTNVKHNELQV